MGKHQEALDDFNMAIQVDGGKGPRAYEVYLKMGDVLRSAGDFAQALQAYDAAVQIATKQDANKQVFLCVLACMCTMHAHTCMYVCVCVHVHVHDNLLTQR